MTPRLVVALSLAAACTPGRPAPAQQPTFTPLGVCAFQPRISADGSTVVLDGHRWRAPEGFRTLDTPPGACWLNPVGLASDGTVVAGRVPFGEECDPARTVLWDAAGGATVPDIPGYPIGIASGGLLMAGNWAPPACDPCPPPALALIADAGGSGWSFLPLIDGIDAAQARAIAGDAPVVVGAAYPPPPAGGLPCRWDLLSGAWSMSILTPSPGTATAVSADGSTIALQLGGAMFRLRDGVLEPLGQVLDEPGEAAGMSANGDTIVGWLLQPERDGAFIWTREEGRRLISDLLTERGIDLAAWRLDTASGVSADGRTIVGTGSHELESGQIRQEAWIIDLGPDCTCDFNRDRAVDSQDFYAFLTAFFQGFPAADINGDTHVNSQDLFDFLTCLFAAPNCS